MRTFTLRNDFHNTECKVRCEGFVHCPGEVTIRPSKRQLARIRRELCGHDDCTCGESGMRGQQLTPEGIRLIVDRDAEFSG